jgi:catalase
VKFIFKSKIGFKIIMNKEKQKIEEKEKEKYSDGLSSLYSAH